MIPGLKRKLPIFLVALLVLGLGVSWANYNSDIIHAQGADEQNEQAVEALPLPISALGNPYLIADVAERVTPAVVYIEATWPPRERARTNPFFNDPFFREFFPFNPWPDISTRPQTQRGTGFIIDQEGHILTNQHVVGNPGTGQTITVKIHTADFQGDVEATLLGADELLDLAVLKIEKPEELKEFPTVPLGDSHASRPGEFVIAIGNPYGEQFEHTVTVGVLSAKGREVQIYDNSARTWRTYRNLMQTDAAINPGNSGGPLINIRGEVIGINTAVNASAQGIGFAIPINTAIAVKDQLITTGHVRRAFLGIYHSNLTQRDAGILGLSKPEGVLIEEIIPDTAAEQAGLKAYDVILRVDGTAIRNGQDLQAVLEVKVPGDQVTIEVWRDRQTIKIPVTLGERPPETDEEVDQP